MPCLISRDSDLTCLRCCLNIWVASLADHRPVCAWRFPENLPLKIHPRLFSFLAHVFGFIIFLSAQYTCAPRRTASSLRSEIRTVSKWNSEQSSVNKPGAQSHARPNLARTSLCLPCGSLCFSGPRPLAVFRLFPTGLAEETTHSVLCTPPWGWPLAGLLVQGTASLGGSVAQARQLPPGSPAPTARLCSPEGA